MDNGMIANSSISLKGWYRSSSNIDPYISYR